MTSDPPIDYFTPSEAEAIAKQIGAGKRDIFDEIAQPPATAQAALPAPKDEMAILALVLMISAAAFACIWKGRNQPALRKVLVVIGVTALVITALNPPWRITTKNSAGHTTQTRIELSWIFFDPTPPSTQYGNNSGAIASDVICLEFLSLVAVGLTIHYLLPRPKL